MNMFLKKLHYYFWSDVLDYKNVYLARTKGILIILTIVVAIRVFSDYAKGESFIGSMLESRDLLGTFLIVFALLMLPFFVLRVWAKYHYVTKRCGKGEEVWSDKCDPWQLYLDYDAQK